MTPFKVFVVPPIAVSSANVIFFYNAQGIYPGKQKALCFPRVLNQLVKFTDTRWADTLKNGKDKFMGKSVSRIF